MKERSLLVFTIFSQLAAGTTLVACFLVSWFSHQAISFYRGSLLGIPLMLSLIAALGALAISFFHLGKPLHAINALRHLRSSSLSNEIFSATLFLIALLITVTDVYFVLLPESLQPLLMVLLCGLGVFFMYEMAQLYRLKTVPFWNSRFTFATFFTTTLLLGSVSLAAQLPFITVDGNAFLSPPIAALLLAISVFSLAQLAVSFFHIRTIEQYPDELRLQLIKQRDAQRAFIITRTILLIILAILCAVLVLNPEFWSTEAGFVIFLLALTAEAIGRSMFYALYVRVGV